MARAKPTLYHGVQYRSRYEAEVAKQLEDAGMDFTFESEVVTYIEPATTRKYIPDFILANGIRVEAKGRWTAVDRKKIIRVVEQNPKLDLRMLFQRDRKLNKGSKTFYGQWCDKRGIKWAVGAIPQEWLDEKIGGKKA